MKPLAGPSFYAETFSPIWLKRLTSGKALFVTIMVIYMGTIVGPVDLTTNDPEFVPLTARSLVHEHNLDLNEYTAERLLGHPAVIYRPDAPPVTTVLLSEDDVQQVREDGGAIFDYFPWTTALAGAPAIVLADAKATVFGGRDSSDLLRDDDFEVYHVIAASFVVAAAALVIRRIGLILFNGTLGRRRVLAFVLALLFGLGTTAWSTASRALWQHAPSLLFASLLLSVLLALERSEREETAAEPSLGSNASGIAVGLLASAVVIVRPTNVALALLAALWLAVRYPRLLLPAALSAATVIGLFVLANYSLLGEPVPQYYAGSRLELNRYFFEAFAAQWVSPSRGLVWASPFVIFAAYGLLTGWRAGVDRSLLIICAVVPIAVAVNAAAFAHWWAGHSYGPRFMTEALPPLMILVALGLDAALPKERPHLRWSRADRLWLIIAVVVGAWSVAFHATGALSAAPWCWNVQPRNIDADPQRVWSITDPQFARPLRLAVDGHFKEAVLGRC